MTGTPLHNIRALVCGGRDFGVQNKDGTKPHALIGHEYDFLRSTLARVHARRTITVVIHGAARGADTLGKEWAEDYNVPTEPYPADWKRYGKIAGRLRNAEMLVKGKPDVVIAFPGGVGTAHMIQIARDADVPVYEPLYALP